MGAIDTIKRHKICIIVGSAMLIVGIVFIRSSGSPKQKPIGGCETDVQPQFDADESKYPNISSSDLETLASFVGYLKYDPERRPISNSTTEVIYRPLQLNAIDLIKIDISNSTSYVLKLKTDCATGQLRIYPQTDDKDIFHSGGMEFKDVRYQGDYFICHHPSLLAKFQSRYYCNSAVANCFQEDNGDVTIAMMYFKLLQFELKGDKNKHKDHVYSENYHSIC